MNPIAVIALIVTGVFVISSISAAGTADRLDYVIDDVKFRIVSVWHLTTSIVINIQNPTSNTLTVNSLVGDVYVNGDYLGNVSSFTKTEIVGNNQTPYTVALDSNIFSLSTELQSLISNFHGLTLQLKGTINAQGLTIPVDLQYKVL